MSNTSTSLGLNCPFGGTFFVCEHNVTEFIGCCTIDPCAAGQGTCPPQNLRSASFAPSSFASIPRLDCDSEQGPSNWYTCNFTSPPFLGCCMGDPCAASCAQARLIPAKLGSDLAARSVFLHATTSVALTPTAPASTPAAPVPTTTTNAPVVRLSTPIIAGIALGSAVMLAILVMVYIWSRGAVKKRDKVGPIFEVEGDPGVPAIPASQPGELHADVPMVLLPGRHIAPPERAFMDSRQLARPHVPPPSRAWAQRGEELHFYYDHHQGPA
ncbi:hypothetical protein B0H63DRAFT_477609, partial [Podospora didyma]